MKDPDRIYRRYLDLQSYVAWTDEDAERVRGLGPILEPHLPGLVDDFYAEIARHPAAHKVFSGGQARSTGSSRAARLAGGPARRPV